jgi:serine phosphatase RsbU (regulator of sigma subunit)
MGRLRSAVRAYLHSERTPAAALARLDSLIESSDEVTFATLCLVAYSPASGAYQLASAGHLPPVLREAGADSARTLEAPLGPPLGTGTPPRGNCGGVLQPGEMLVVYTDGLLEIRGTDIGARLQLLCSSVAAAPDNAEAAAEHLLDAMLGSPRAARDDTALLVVRRDA